MGMTNTLKQLEAMRTKGEYSKVKLYIENNYISSHKLTIDILKEYLTILFLMRENEAVADLVQTVRQNANLEDNDLYWLEIKNLAICHGISDAIKKVRGDDKESVAPEWFLRWMTEESAFLDGDQLADLRIEDFDPLNYKVTPFWLKASGQCCGCRQRITDVIPIGNEWEYLNSFGYMLICPNCLELYSVSNDNIERAWMRYLSIDKKRYGSEIFDELIKDVIRTDENNSQQGTVKTSLQTIVQNRIEKNCCSTNLSNCAFVQDEVDFLLNSKGDIAEHLIALAFHQEKENNAG